MLYDKVVDMLATKRGELFAVAVRLVQKRFERGIVDHFVDAERARIAVDILGQIDVVVGHYVEFLAVLGEHPHVAYARVLNFDSELLGENIGGGMRRFVLGARVHNAVRVHDVARDAVAVHAVAQMQLFVVFIAADARQVVLAAVEEHAVNKALNRIDGGRLAAPELVVKLVQRALLVDSGLVLFVAVTRASDLYHGVVRENLFELRLRTEPAVGNRRQAAQKHRREHLLLTVHAHPQNARGILFEFQPRATRRNVLRTVMRLTRFDILFEIEIHAGRAH